jgi:hypothetical protein
MTMAFMRNLLETKGDRDSIYIVSRYFKRGLARKLRIFPIDGTHEKEYANDKEVEKIARDAHTRGQKHSCGILTTSRPVRPKCAQAICQEPRKRDRHRPQGARKKEQAGRKALRHSLLRSLGAPLVGKH